MDQNKNGYLGVTQIENVSLEDSGVWNL